MFDFSRQRRQYVAGQLIQQSAVCERIRWFLQHRFPIPNQPIACPDAISESVTLAEIRIDLRAGSDRLRNYATHWPFDAADRAAIVNFLTGQANVLEQLHAMLVEATLVPVDIRRLLNGLASSLPAAGLHHLTDTELLLFQQGAQLDPDYDRDRVVHHLETERCQHCLAKIGKAPLAVLTPVS